MPDAPPVMTAVRRPARTEVRSGSAIVLRLVRRSQRAHQFADDGAAQKMHTVLSPVELVGIDEARHAEDVVALGGAAPSAGGLAAQGLVVCGGDERSWIDPSRTAGI